MKKLSVKEKQKVYEFLLEKGVPDLYAALIAARQLKPVAGFQPEDVADYVENTFDWFDTPEDYDLWNLLAHELCNELTTSYYQAYTELPISTVVYKEDLHIAGGVDFDNVVIQCRPPQPQEHLDYKAKMEEVSSWQKIKCFVGRLFYKV